jgi:predicted  nucleic acid-binding Zn-ribbon protein
MSSQEIIQENIQKINRLQNEMSNLHNQINLVSTRDAIEDLETGISGFPERVKQLRNRNYAFEKGLESQARSFPPRWTSMKHRVHNEVTRQTQLLTASLKPTETKMSRLSSLQNAPTAARPLIAQVESELDNMKNKASAADRAIRGMFDDLEKEVSQLSHHLDHVEEMLDHLDEASFALMPNEAGILAVKATFVEGKEDKDDPRGILFLTDHRLLFEQKQEVAKKKVLFITTEKELVQELIMDIPLGLIEETTTSKRGLLKNEDHLEMTFHRDAPMREAHLHIFGQDCVEWKTEIQRTQAGEYDRDRAIAVDDAAAEEIRNVPTVCPGCGASIQQKVLRGMDSITCQYCGTVIRI